jgi:hypothetical protein
MKAILKVSSQAGQSGIVKKISVESAQDDNCGEVKRSKRYISYVVDSQEVD